MKIVYFELCLIISYKLNYKMNMFVPKGAYHNHCRNTHNTRSLQQTRQFRSIKSDRTHKNLVAIQQFNDFQSYLMHIQQRNSHRHVGVSSQGSSLTRQAKTSRPQTHDVARRSLQKYKQGQQPVKPFFPFFKCKIESYSVPVKDGIFRINTRKFKLNHRIIEQNMGRENRKFIND